MKFFIWLNGEPQSEVERAISVLNKQKVCNAFSLQLKPEECTHFLIGNIKKGFFSRKARFDHYDVKFSKAGTEAMISKNGSVDFFFASKEEVDQLKESIINRFK
jgi:hypothetical protein